jgi:hypothetical protein
MASLWGLSMKEIAANFDDVTYCSACNTGRLSLAEYVLIKPRNFKGEKFLSSLEECGCLPTTVGWLIEGHKQRLYLPPRRLTSGLKIDWDGIMIESDFGADKCCTVKSPTLRARMAELFNDPSLLVQQPAKLSEDALLILTAFTLVTCLMTAYR